MPSVYLLLSGLLAGIVSFRIRETASVIFCLSSAAVFLISCLHWKSRRGPFIGFAVMMAVGFGVSLSAQFRSVHAVETWAPQSCVSLEGIVQDLPAVKQTGKRSKVRFVMDAERILYSTTDCASRDLPHVDNLRVQKATGFVQVFLMNPPDLPAPGDRIRVFGGFERPRALLNPGEMDYAAYLASNRIFAVFSGMGPASMRILEPGARLDWNAWMERLRGALARRFERIFGAGELHAEVLKPLLLGLRSQFPQDLWQMMMRTGTAHIISISGLHMSVLSAFIYLFLLLAIRSQKKAAAGAALALVLYMFVAGASIPVQRAALMGAAAYAGLIAEREIQSLRLLAWACLVQLVQDPLAIESISFQLSFVSVAILLLLRYLPPIHWAVEPFRATGLVLAGTLPMAAWHFHMVSWSALAANLWAIPFFNFALISGAAVLVLADIPAAGWLIAKICSLCLDAGLCGIHFLAQWRYGWTVVAQPEIWKIVHYYVWAACWFRAAMGSKKIKPLFRYALLAGWIGAGSLFWISFKNPAWTVTVLSGTRVPMVHIQSGRSHWLVNAGQASGGYETERRLLPYLKMRGIQAVDGLLLTDYSKDTSLAICRLTEEIRLKQIYGPAPKSLQDRAFFQEPAKSLWRRAGSVPGIQSGMLSIQSHASRGKIPVVQIRTGGGVTVVLVTQLDAESRAVIASLKHSPLILVLYGRAAGNQPETRKHRRELRKLLPRAVWVSASEPGSRGMAAGKTSAKLKTFSLKKLGALQIGEVSEDSQRFDCGAKNCGSVYLQFLSGYRVTMA